MNKNFDKFEELFASMDVFRDISLRKKTTVIVLQIFFDPKNEISDQK